MLPQRMPESLLEVNPRESAGLSTLHTPWTILFLSISFLFLHEKPSFFLIGLLRCSLWYKVVTCLYSSRPEFCVFLFSGRLSIRLVHIGLSQILTYKPREFCQCSIPKRHCNATESAMQSLMHATLQHGTEATKQTAAEAAIGVGVEGKTPLHNKCRELVTVQASPQWLCRFGKMKWSGYNFGSQFYAECSHFS